MMKNTGYILAFNIICYVRLLSCSWLKRETKGIQRKERKGDRKRPERRLGEKKIGWCHGLVVVCLFPVLFC